MTKASAGNFFEDFSFGQTITHPTPRTLGEGDASLYIALTGARQVLHSSRPVAHALGYQDRPLDDLLLFHIAFGKTVPDISINAVANLGYADVRFLRPAYAGDTISTESSVIGLKQNSSGKNGVVWVYSTARNQNGEALLSWVRWVMVHKNNLELPPPEAVVPELPDCIPAGELSLPPFLDASAFEPVLTGGEYFWDDYVPGERIDHPGGMTVDESDHTLATKLYQNNARLHFDEFGMKASPFGRRLMYGGHVISVCRALSYDGLENALSILAINGGTHCNPSFGGDTLYTYSEVLEKWDLPGRSDVGALRLRMVGVKNFRLAELTSPHIEQDGKKRYHPNVVLDLDYTVMMPRR